MFKEDAEKLKHTLKSQGYKLTPQRRAVLDVIIDNEGKHLSPEEIYDIVKQNCPDIGLATVYRTLNLLEKMGVVCKMNFDDGCNRYELVHDEEDHQHHHLICRGCGKVEEVEDDLLEVLEEKIEEKYNFKINDHSVKFYGYCSECRKNLRQ
ncbi:MULTISPECIES: Fur family transcriptional regulator [Caloramator]|uniref:Fur family transcriptional regulator, ferric uptake regulator n=1 Tax=Caloramator proteoclasticus DSM 10124 TaxID=1121262 RepID=A0A1M4VE40_9CLOT|nr:MULTISPECIES: Fur family transcriptional regulator [Caloramator]SHE67123.1 Fur family transcriptional regulator, ferric uptake regulator [Caloramator proteoclasticus DSM 10124]